MYKTTRALVLREVKYKEADKILTVLTETDGKLTVKARGALRKSSRCGAAAQALCYSEMTLFGSAGGKWTLDEAETLEQFLPLRNDLEALALGSYFAELLEAVSDEDSPDRALLQLGLNSLYALSLGEKLWTPVHIKAAFELRLMCISGFAPSLDGGGELFSLRGGCLHGARAVEPPGAAGVSLPVDEAVRRAMAYIAEAEPKRIFSFRIPEDSERRLAGICEAYVSAQLERGFSTLDYWKSLKS